MRLKLNGSPLESQLQALILRSLGVELLSPKWDRNARVWVEAPSGVFVSRRGDMFWRANSGVFRGAGGSWISANPRGTADILGCVAGRFVGMEVKRPGEDMSRVQSWWHGIVDAAHGVRAVVECVSDARSVVERVRENHTAKDPLL